jgi:hypothetical protein
MKKDAEHREALLRGTGAPPLREKAASPKSAPSGLSFDRFSVVFESAPDLATLGAARDLLVWPLTNYLCFFSVKSLSWHACFVFVYPPPR